MTKLREAVSDAVRLHDLTLGYERHPAVHHLSGGLSVGSLTAVVGPNGAGKSTLLKGLMGLLRPLGGRIEWGSGNPRQAAYLPQQAELERDFPITVEEVASLGLWRQLGIWHPLTATLRDHVYEVLAMVGLASFAQREVGSLSGGQFQRMLFARLLLQNAEVILLDEPFTAIDERTTIDLLALVKRLHSEGRTVVAVLHDLDLVRNHFPETLLLAREAVAWGPTPQVLTADNLTRARQLQEAWDEQAPVCVREAA
ncbi:zinc/manganese transport system ATP-binding protein [Gammaproteobacteria bacterium]